MTKVESKDDLDISVDDLDMVYDSDELKVFVHASTRIGFEFTAGSNLGHRVQSAQPFLMQYGVRIDTSLPKKLRREAKIRLAQSFVHAVMAQSTDISSSFAEIAQFIEDRAGQAARFSYLLSSLLFTFVFAIAVWVIRETRGNINETFSCVLLGGIMGTVGAMISVLLRSRQIEVDPYASLAYTALQAIARVLLGFIFGAVAVIAVKANAILGFAESNTYLLLAFSLAAGFSERLIPEILTSLEKQSQIP